MKYCIICKKELTNPKSMDRGMGPICYQKLQQLQLNDELLQKQLDEWIYGKKETRGGKIKI